LHPARAASPSAWATRISPPRCRIRCPAGGSRSSTGFPDR